MRGRWWCGRAAASPRANRRRRSLRLAAKCHPRCRSVFACRRRQIPSARRLACRRGLACAVRRRLRGARRASEAVEEFLRTISPGQAGLRGVVPRAAARGNGLTGASGVRSRSRIVAPPGATSRCCWRVARSEPAPGETPRRVAAVAHGEAGARRGARTRAEGSTSRLRSTVAGRRGRPRWRRVSRGSASAVADVPGPHRAEDPHRGRHAHPPPRAFGGTAAHALAHVGAESSAAGASSAPASPQLKRDHVGLPPPPPPPTPTAAPPASRGSPSSPCRPAGSGEALPHDRRASSGRAGARTARSRVNHACGGRARASPVERPRGRRCSRTRRPESAAIGGNARPVGVIARRAGLGSGRRLAGEVGAAARLQGEWRRRRPGTAATLRRCCRPHAQRVDDARATGPLALQLS